MVDTNHNSEAMFHRPLLCAAFVVVALTSVACDKYQPTKHIEGTYRPSQCVTLQGIIPGGWLSHHNTIHPTICQPMRVSEIGVYTYGSGWSVPGIQAEVGRLEFADAGVLVELSHLKQTGTFVYRDRDATLGEWTRNNPVLTGLLVLVGIVVAVTVAVRVVAGYSRRRRERERLKAEEAARLARLKAEEAARPERLKAEEAAKEARKRQEAEAAERAAEARRQRDEYRQQLEASSVDRLRFEYEKRQRSIQALHARIAERNHALDENEETMRRWPNNDDIQISCLDSNIKIMDQIGDLQRDIADAEREMTEIQQVLDTKWR